MGRPAFPFHGIFSSLQQEQAGAKAGQSAGDDGVVVRAAAQTQGQVAVDIYEQDDYYIIKAPIAGVRLCDLDIEISDNVVTIRGTRQQSDDAPQNAYYAQECFWGQFSRTVTLPCAVDPKRVRATFNKECILKIIIPKEEKVKIVRINEG